MPGLSPLKTLLACVVSLAALLISSAQTNAADPLPIEWLEAVFESTVPTISGGQGPEHVDLHEGHSPISNRWLQSFESFERSDRAHPPTAGGVVFVGSSSISLWDDLPEQFPSRNIVQRGLGGALMADCARHVDRLILPYRPSTVVVYAGDNDLAAGVSPETIVADYVDLVRQVRSALPHTKVIFVSIKPSPLRESLLPQVQLTNTLMAAYAKTDPHLAFVNVFTPMLDASGRPRAELFRADALHMNAAGYAIWRRAIADHLD